MESERQAAVGDAAITVLARLGVRGLTHRAVDGAAGLPDGATSNVARTRSALLRLALQRLIELEASAFSEMADAAHSEVTVSTVARTFATRTHVQLAERQDWTLARYALALDTGRDDRLLALYQDASQRLVEIAEGALRDLGSPTPARHASRLLAYIEGLLFSTVVDRRPAPSVDDLTDGFVDLLSGMLRRRTGR